MAAAGGCFSAAWSSSRAPGHIQDVTSVVSCRSCNLGSPRGFQSLAASLSFRTGQNFPPSLSTSGRVAGRLPGRAGGLGTEVACSPWPGGELEAWACVIQSSFSEPLPFFCFCFFLFSWISCPPHLKVSYLKVQMCSSAPGRVLGPCWGLSECLKQEAGGGGVGKRGAMLSHERSPNGLDTGEPQHHRCVRRQERRVQF